MDIQPILVVEDDPDSSAALRKLLTDKGYEVRTAENGQRALDLLDGGLRPSLLLIDLRLPHVTGWDLLSHLQTDPQLRYLPRVVITAVPREQVKVVADAIFSKPLDFEKLIAKIDELIGRGGRRPNN